MFFAGSSPVYRTAEVSLSKGSMSCFFDGFEQIVKKSRKNVKKGLTEERKDRIILKVSERRCC